MTNPEKADSWLDGAQYGFGYIANPLNLPTEIRENYGMLCDYTHPNFNGAVGNLMIDKKSKDIDFLMIPIFQKKNS
jgi:hypothetical protein